MPPAWAGGNYSLWRTTALEHGPQPFQNWFPGRHFSHRPVLRGCWLRDDSSALHSLCSFFLFWFHPLHLKSSGVRCRRLGSPAVEHPPALTDSSLCYKCELFSFPPAFRSHGIGNSPTHPQKQAKDYCRLKHFKDILFESIHIILIIDYETMIL